MKNHIIITLILGGTLASVSSAAIVGQYSFTGAENGTDSGFSVESPDANLNFSPLTSSFAIGSGLDQMGVVDSFVAGSAYSVEPFASYTLDGKGFEVGYPVLQNSTDPGDSTDYLQFDVTAASGYSLAVNSVSIDFGTDFNTTANPRAYYNLYYSLDGTNWLKTGSSSEALSNSNVYRIRDDVAKSPNPTANGFTGTETLYFRMTFGIGGASGSTAKFLFVDDIKLDGTVTVVPEPSSMALFAGFTALGLILYRRRKL